MKVDMLTKFESVSGNITKTKSNIKIFAFLTLALSQVIHNSEMSLVLIFISFLDCIKIDAITPAIISTTVEEDINIITSTSASIRRTQNQTQLISQQGQEPLQ